MDEVSAEIWKGAPELVEVLKGVSLKAKTGARKELLKSLGVSNDNGKLDPSKLPSTEDFEMALQVVMLELLETQDANNAAAVPTLLDSAIYLVEELFCAAGPSEVETCKSWWALLISAAEDVCRLLPTEHIQQLVEDLKTSLLDLKSAHIGFAQRRLAEFDAEKEHSEKEKEKEKERQKKGEAEKETDKSKDEKGGKKQPEPAEKEKEKSAEASKAKLTDRRLEERKALITKLGISPNGTLHLSLTAVLKHLTGRLCNSIHAPLRANVALLLEQLLPVDHKAIANNQKSKTTDFIQADDLDKEEDAMDVFKQAAPAPVEVDKEGEAGQPVEPHQDSKEKKDPSVLDDPAVNYNLYRSFWSLQENLQAPERVFDTRISWKTFHDSASTMVQLFLKYPVHATGAQAWTPPESAALRFAPRAKAFSMQLEDPGFRLFVVSQLLMAFRTIDQDTPAKKSFAATLRDHDLTKKDLAKLRADCEKVAAATKESFPEVLKHLIDREAQFTAWKLNACKEFKRESLEMLHAVAPLSDKLSDPDVDLLPPERRDEKTTSSLLEILRNPGWDMEAPKDDDAEALRMVQTRKKCHDYLDRLLTEDDPAEGIEDEYKVKANKVYMWQAKRLFCQHHLRRYAGDASAKTGFLTHAAQALGRKEFVKENGNADDDKKLNPELEVAEPEEAEANAKRAKESSGDGAPPAKKARS